VLGRSLVLAKVLGVEGPSPGFKERAIFGVGIMPVEPDGRFISEASMDSSSDLFVLTSTGFLSAVSLIAYRSIELKRSLFK
jgi:hypothetical protein